MSKLICLLPLCVLAAVLFGSSDAAPTNAAAPAPAPAPAAEADDYSAGNYYYNTNFNPIYSMNGGRGGGKKANRPGWLGLIPGRQDNNGIKTNFKTSYGAKGAYSSEYSACLSNDVNKNRGVNLVAILNGCGAGLGRR